MSPVPFKLPKVYPITDRQLSGVSHAEQVQQLIDGGATLIQLRDKHSAPREFYPDAVAALRLARAHDVTILINDRADFVLALKAAGLHLGQTDLPVNAARAVLGAKAIIGLSTHNVEQAQSAIKQPIDYLAFGPIFDTGTKDAPDPTVGLKELTRVRRLTTLPLVAIGGITHANAQAVFEAGADSIAVISAVMARPGIAKSFQQLLNLSP